MDDLSKIIGENGCAFLDNSATNIDCYQIYVAEAATFTTLDEAMDKDVTGVSVLTDMNLSGKTIPAGCILTPKASFFNNITVSSGSLIVYKETR